jgi:DNA-binding NarL/FixJ family response regulator
MLKRETRNSSVYPDGVSHVVVAAPTTANPRRMAELTKREREVLSLLAQGLTDRVANPQDRIRAHC